MSTPYAISTSIGSSGYSPFVFSPNIGPLSTNNYPSIVSSSNNGVLNGTRPTPAQFYSMQQSPYFEDNVSTRQIYKRSVVPDSVRMQQIAQAKASTPIAYYHAHGTRTPVSSHMNYIAPKDSSQHLQMKKSVNVGKSAYKVGLPTADDISTKNYNVNTVRTALRRSRSSGASAPKKKTSIYNHVIPTSLGTWGAFPRQNY